MRTVVRRRFKSGRVAQSVYRLDSISVCLDGAPGRDPGRPDAEKINESTNFPTEKRDVARDYKQIKNPRRLRMREEFRCM